MAILSATVADTILVDALVARQAILDRQRNLYGYELLYRSNAFSKAFDGTEAAEATMQVLSNTLLSIGAEGLLCGKKAFINFDDRILAANMHLSFPQDSIVVEILETVNPTAEFVALCQQIARQGYTLALDDFSDEAGLEPLTRLAGVIKVDVLLTSRKEQERLIRKYKSRSVLMLAEKVETHTDFEWARSAGYDLFQGYFFARPAIVRTQQVPAYITACLQLLRELQHTELDFRRLERLIREDVSLTYKLLRFTNSAMFQRRHNIQSIPAALTHLGENNVRRWVSLATLPKLATNKPSELVTLSLVRARFCQNLAALAGIGDPNEAYLLGMFSLLDALIDQPLNLALRNLELGDRITQALLGSAEHDEGFSRLYQLALCYEAGNWDGVELISRRCGVASSAVTDAYVDSTANTGQLQSIGI